MKKNNNIKSDPFTRTPGVAGSAYIDMHIVDEIVSSFTSNESFKYIYRIVGVRGSGKTVVFARTLKKFKEMNNWLVYSLSAAGNPTTALIAKLSSEKIIGLSKVKTTMQATLGAEGNVGVLKGSALLSMTREKEKKDVIYSEEAILDELIEKIKQKGRKILIGIDDISRTNEIVKFLSIIGKYLIEEDSSLYFICTGLSKNIEDFSKEKNLTFFKRSDTIEINQLSKYEIAEKYRHFLGVSDDEAARLAKFVKGYAYAYQVLGSLYFTRSNETEEEIIQEFEKILFQDSYDLIWKSLTSSEKDFVKVILNSTGEIKDIKQKMKNSSNLSVLRDRLIKKHIVNARERGLLSIELPRFKEYVSRWDD